MNLAKEKIEKLRRRIEDLQFEIYMEVRKHYPEFNSCWHVIGHWDCNKSPFGLCLYNNIEDKVHDCCLFCGCPEERK